MLKTSKYKIADEIIFVIGYFVCPIILIILAATEIYHLATGHRHISEDARAFQQAMLSGIRDAAHRAIVSKTGEDLIKNFNARYVGHMSKEDVLSLPERSQGLYSSYIEGSLVPLEWDIYDADAIPGYKASLAIGAHDNCFLNAFFKYTLCEGE